MQRAVIGSVIGALVLALSACGSNDGREKRDALVYAAVIRALAPPPPEAEPDEPVDTDVFVWGGDNRTIPLDVQARTVEELDDYSSIRFVDARDEAVDVDEPGEPVRRDGVLIVLGPVPAEGDSVTVHASVEAQGSVQDVEIRLERSAGRWKVVQPADLAR